MPEKDKAGSSVDFRIVALVLAVLGGAYLVPSALRTERPPEQKTLRRTALGDQIIPARLWQDPLAAALSYKKTTLHQTAPPVGDLSNAVAATDRFYSLTEIGNQISRHWARQTNSPITVLEVMVSGGSYAEDSEERRRARYAVLSALAVGGYQAEDAEHLGYAQQTWPRGEKLEGFSADSVPPLDSTNLTADGLLVVPYEWFGPNNLQPVKGDNDALVLWLNADCFEDHPAKRLAQFNHRLRELAAVDAAVVNPQPQTSRAHPRLAFKLIDPRLEAMLGENFGTKTDDHGIQAVQELNTLELYSSWSTTADGLMTTNVTTPRAAVFSQLARNWGTNFWNCTCLDNALAGALVAELQLRGVDASNPNDGIVLISEWDTPYGRALPLTFAAVAKAATAPRAAGDIALEQVMWELRTNRASWPSQIVSFSYLRGVDGLLPDSPDTNAASVAGNDDTKSATPRAEGDSQLDYLPRLAAQVKDLESKFDAQGQECQLKAIGILGSDVYDKLLVMQTLRRTVPGVIYFTTDLDARLLYPGVFKWTRNTVVASSFGLQLAPKFQRGIPPFRDTYQTGQYLAGLAALNYPGIRTLLQQTNALVPRLFEIGRHGAYDLQWQDGALLQPQTRPRLFSAGFAAKALVLAALGALSLGLFSQTARGLVKDVWHAWSLDPAPVPATRRRHEDRLSAVAVFFKRRKAWVFRAAILGPLLIFLCFLFFMARSDADPRGEPFSLTEGISIWPAELLRLLAAWLAFYFLYRSHVELRRNKQELHDEYQFPLEAHHIDTDWQTRKGQVCIEYDGASALEERIRRLWLPVLVYFALAVALFGLLRQPFCPYRGHLSNCVNSAVLWLEILQVILIFFVVDSSGQCQKFIQNLMAAPGPWPPRVCDAFQHQVGLECKDMTEYIDMMMIAKRTEVVGKQIFYPFATLFLLIIARNNYFAQWDWPPSVVIILGLNAVYALYTVWSVRKAAEAARTTCLEKMRNRWLKAINHPDRALRKQLRLLLEGMASCDRGAFAPITQQPVIRALLMPFGAAGIATALSFLG